MQKFIYHSDLNYRIMRHLFFFIGIVFAISLFLYYSGISVNLPEALMTTLLNSLFFLGYGYLTIFLLIPSFLLKGKVAGFLILFIMAGIILSVLKLLTSDNLFNLSFSSEFLFSESQGIAGRLILNAKNLTFFVALLCVVKFIKDFIYTERQLRELEKQNREARQRLLQSQLNPHFLFNTINNLYALSLLNPAKTLTVTKKIQKVSDYIVEQSRCNFLFLQEEIDLVRNYIYLEKLRYGNRLKVKTVINGNVKDWQLPPMVLFCLVENGIQHGSRTDAGNPWITVLVDAQQYVLLLQVTNSKPPSGSISVQVDKKGEGLQNLKRRLEILYPAGNYTIIIDENEQIYSICLKLNKLKNGLDSTSYR